MNPKEVVSMTDCIGTLFDRFIVFQIHNLLIGLVETPMNGEQSLGYPSDSCGAPGQVMAKADIVRLGQKRPFTSKGLHRCLRICHFPAFQTTRGLDMHRIFMLSFGGTLFPLLSSRIATGYRHHFSFQKNCSLLL